VIAIYHSPSRSRCGGNRPLEIRAAADTRDLSGYVDKYITDIYRSACLERRGESAAPRRIERMHRARRRRHDTSRTRTRVDVTAPAFYISINNFYLAFKSRRNDFKPRLRAVYRFRYASDECVVQSRFCIPGVQVSKGIILKRQRLSTSSSRNTQSTWILSP